MNTQLHRCLKQLSVVTSLILLFASCKKNIDAVTDEVFPSKATKIFSSQVVSDWINFDLRLLRTNATQLNNFIMMQHWAYSSIALYEAVVPGMPGYTTLAGQLNEMPVMPETVPGKEYHWPATTNTVLAAMVRNFYPDLPVTDKTATDSLENVLNTRFQNEINAETFQRSVEFGKIVAQRVYDWSKTDGSLTVHPAYVIPAGPGLWQKHHPDFQILRILTGVQTGR